MNNESIELLALLLEQKGSSELRSHGPPCSCLDPPAAADLCNGTSHRDNHSPKSFEFMSNFTCPEVRCTELPTHFLSDHSYRKLV